VKLRHYPARLAAGAFILNSGLGKRDLPEEAYAGMQDAAAASVPAVKQLPATTFGKALSAGEIALGAALVLPFVPTWIGAAGLAVFSGGLLNMYRNIPKMTEDDGIRPSQEGTGLAKDVFMAGIAGTLLVDCAGSAVADRSAARKVEKAVAKTEKRVARETERALRAQAA
jgi:uncharacterized membrane protein YphA (DoxX/SURF4 family)